ncbi:MAG TPA: hypothetical protein VJK09_02075 [Candidatus Paceibacterota bacterium]
MEVKKIKAKIICITILLITLVMLAKISPVKKEGITFRHDGNNLVLLLEPKNGEVFAVSGWQIKGDVMSNIPTASNLPLQGKINEEGPIILSKKGEIIVSWAHSPLGVSFRENKCTGLLNLFQKFEPTLTESCTDCRGTSEYPEYNVCVYTHKADPDFFLNTWRIYLNSDVPLWTQKSRIKLLNQNGSLLARSVSQ